MKTNPPRTGPQPSLRRALGKWDLTAIGINQVIGGAIFLLPSAVAAQVAGWGWIAFLLTGLASLLVALCFAEVSSRFDSTGGPYLYTRAAFGDFVAFEVGWMQWFTRVSSHASVVNGIALALAFYWPALALGARRAGVIIGLTVVLTVINILGIRHSAWVVNILTIGKMLPLAVFILVGIFFVDTSLLGSLGPVTWEQASTAALLLIFVYGGYDVVSVPAGESRNPERHLPFALVMTIVIVTLVMTLGQFVAMGTLPDLASSSTPLADSALLFMGASGALMIGIGSVISMTGNNAGQILTGSRMLFALAENDALPGWFGRVHPKFRTPANAILFSSALALALALTGSFVMMAVVSAVARLVTYTGACAATLVLRAPRFEKAVKRATFIVPGGPIVPVLAVLSSMIILVGATRQQLLGGAAGLAGGAALFLLNRWGRRRIPAPGADGSA
ncbi:MAG: amino acid permease [Acidobacteria bacterium]|nr:amino acid permease [Acidobacteriota bacterium]